MKALVIDASHMAYRIYNVFQSFKRQNMRTKSGIPSGMQFGSLRVIHSMVKKVKPDRIYFVWDRIPSEKRAKDAGYKSNRAGWNDEFGAAIAALQDFWSLMGAHHVWCEGQEADDSVATLVSTTLKDWQCFVMTSDNDYLQLIKDGHVIQIKPPQGKRPEIFCDEEWVKDNWGVEPKLMPHLRALLGDKSDVLPGIPRFNKKKAADLINEAGSIEDLYRRLGEFESRLSSNESQKLAAHADRAKLNLELMKMIEDLPITIEEHEFNRELVAEALKTLEIFSYLRKLGKLEADFTTRPRIKVGEGARKDAP